MALSKGTKFEVLRRDDYTCRYCGGKAPDVELHVDHVIPKSRGGSDKPWNLTAACSSCNLSKGDGVPTSQVIEDVKEAESFYQRSRGLPVFACIYCSKPIQHAPGEDQPTDCEQCNELACNSYEAGLRKGLASALVQN